MTGEHHHRPLGPRDPNCCMSCRIDFNTKMLLDTILAFPDPKRACQRLLLSAGEWLVEKGRDYLAIAMTVASEGSEEKDHLH